MSIKRIQKAGNRVCGFGFFVSALLLIASVVVNVVGLNQWFYAVLTTSIVLGVGTVLAWTVFTAVEANAVNKESVNFWENAYQQRMNLR